MKFSRKISLRKYFSHLMLACMLASIVWAVPLQKVSYGEQSSAQEYEVKAVYLFNFLQFVQWPESRHALSKDGAMVIGIVGESPFGEALEAMQANLHKNQMKPLKIIYYGSYDEETSLSNCHLLFVSSSEKRNSRRLFRALERNRCLQSPIQRTLFPLAG